MIKRGFSIIGLMISTMIASILAVSLTNYLSQVYTFQTITTNIIDADTRVSLVTAQLEADLMGIFVPYENLKEEKDDDKKQKQEQEKVTPEEKEEEEEKKPYENVFLAQTKNEQFNFLTMISTNALNVYWSETVGKPKPNVTRITYRLIADPANKESFMLTRREQKDLVYQPYKDEKQLSDEYVLADGVKECIITYHAQPQASDDTQEQNAETVTWQWPKKKETPEQEDQEDKHEEITLPTMVTLELILWNEQYNRSTPFTYAIEIPYRDIAHSATAEEQEEKEKNQKVNKNNDE